MSPIRYPSNPCVRSFWRPDRDELAALNADGSIVLSVVGRTTVVMDPLDPSHALDQMLTRGHIPETPEDLPRVTLPTTAAKNLAGASCGYLCRMDGTYGFIPEAGCPIHDADPATTSAPEPASAPQAPEGRS